ncbi:MAG: SDR family oxidoreductase [Candidatus Hydrogenedentes bacterium]|nr:SDR family oxidoreductase [Candidatus Hydrogenedentota bacterium]
MEFRGKVVLVTGAAGGLGREICEGFAALGAEVYGSDLRGEAARNFAQGDITDSRFMREWVDGVLDKTNRIDVLVNSAGICPRTPLMDIAVEEWDKVLNVNLTSAFLLSQMLMKAMVSQRGGAIVNMASLAGKVGGIAVGAHYSASKAGLVCLTKTLALHGAPYGVRVNAVAPGVIDTEMTRAASAAQLEKYKETIPMGRIGDASEVVQPILFLASDCASYITGATLDVNGGLRMD